MRIVVIGESQDLTLIYIEWLARHRGIDVIQLQEERMGLDWSFAFNDKCSNEGHIEKEGEIYKFSDIDGAHVRLHHNPTVPRDLCLPKEEQAVFIVERRAAIHYLLNSMPFVVVNRPCTGRSNASKPYQMYLLSSFGFKVPRWILTNVESEAKAFVRDIRADVIYKSPSGQRNRVCMMDQVILQRMKQGTTPLVLQEYIPGRDVRVHVVGNRGFATGVISTGVDHRYDDQRAKYVPTSLPNSIEISCCQFASVEALTIAGFDFRVTEDDQWYCLEMNPVPSFLPYEMQTTQPICSALLDALVKP